jgi:hypothetical protein
MLDESDQYDNLAAGAAYTTPPPGPDPGRFVAVNVHPMAQQAHQLAGEAVAVALTGSTVKHVQLGSINFSTDDEGADTPWQLRHDTGYADLPFVWFAALRASAMWSCWYEDADVDTAMDVAWIDNTEGPSRDGIADKYESRFEELSVRFGSTPSQRVWEEEWHEKLERFDLAVCEVAEMLVEGQQVTHEDVQAAVDRCRND